VASLEAKRRSGVGDPFLDESPTLARGYGAACYALSRFALLYGIGFTGNVAVPRSVDHAVGAPLGEALLIDLMLLGLFAVAYHCMPRAIERGTGALVGSLALFLLYWQWRALPAVVWDVPSPAGRLGAHVLFWLGWASVVCAATGIRRLDRFELRIRYFMWRERPCGGRRFGSRLVRWPARHPIVACFVVAFWATPVMTAGHLLFAVAATGLTVAVVRGEEHGARRRSALAVTVIAELSGTVFPALRQATVFAGSVVRPESSPPRRCRPSSLRPPPARRSGSRRLSSRT
jgi:protein-S-isoprenylcysteine O-methyltransferase Ste14